MKIVDESKKNEALSWARRLSGMLREKGECGVVDEVDKVITEFETHKLTIAVVGLLKRGKSTFCNAWLRRKDDLLAPVDFIPATGVISKFMFSEEREDADVYFLNEVNPRRISWKQIREFASEGGNPENRKNVSEITVYGKFDLDPSVTLIDMPGDASIHQYHTEIVYKYLPEADIIIFLSSANDPITQSELSLLRNVNPDDLKKVFFVINKMDNCDSDELEQAEDHDRETLQNAGISYEKGIYRISALNAMMGDMKDSGMEELRMDISEYINSNKCELLLHGFLARILMITAPVMGKYQQVIDVNSTSREEIEHAICELEGKSESIQRKADDVLNGFSRSWEEMLEQFEAKLPTLEQNVQMKVKRTIDQIPALSIGKKEIQKMPDFIMQTVEDELRKNIEVMEKQIRACYDELVSFPSISTFLANGKITVRTTSNLSGNEGSLLYGGILLGSSWAFKSLIASAATIGQGSAWTSWLGGVIGAGAATALGPFALLFGIGGGAALALPAFSWVRQKKSQKTDLLNDARITIHNIFDEIKTIRIQYLSKQKEIILTKKKNGFDDELKNIQKTLSDALNSRKQLTEGSQEVDKATLILAEYNKFTSEIEAYR